MTFQDFLQQNGITFPKVMQDRYQVHPTGQGTHYGGHGSSYYPPHQTPIPDEEGFSNKKNNYHSGWSSGGGGGKGNAAVSALTLLAFLFFLNVLQQCLNEQNAAMNPQVMIMTAGRDSPDRNDEFDFKTRKTDQTLRPVNTRNNYTKLKPIFANVKNKDDGFPGFVSAMNDEDFETIGHG